MKIHAQEILKRNLQFVLFVAMALICFVTLIFSLRAMRQTSKPVIIGIDANGTRIVTEATDPIYKTEAVAFMNKFFFNAYNFDSQNFFKRLGLATTMMSSELWKRKEMEILDLKAKVERDRIEVSSQVTQISQDESGTYYALVDLKERNRLNQQDHRLKVAIRLKQVERSLENPYGLEVDSYEESILRD